MAGVTEAEGMAHSSRDAEEAAELDTEAGRDPDDQDSPSVTERAVDECDVRSWYPTFRHASFRSEIIHLPEEFVAYLLQDGLHLPATSQAVSAWSFTLGCLVLHVEAQGPRVFVSGTRCSSDLKAQAPLAFLPAKATGLECCIGVRGLLPADWS